MSQLPDFIIIGAMKCATSTLHDQLAALPGVFMTEPKEPNFFSDEDIWARGMSWYRGLFSGARPGELCGESSTHYSKLPRHPKVVERIAEHVPDAKFIYVMRHPIDRLVSHYVHEWSQRVLDVPLSQALREHAALKDFSRYAMQLEPYLATFGKERVLPVFFDRIRAQPQAELERVCAFIGYEGTPTWQEERGPSNVSSERMRTSRWRDIVVNAPILADLRRRFVPQSLRDQIKSLWMMKERPRLTDAEREQLVKTFDPDLARLADWLGMDSLTCDNFVETTSNRAWEWKA